jgi:hypothetical protein
MPRRTSVRSTRQGGTTVRTVTPTRQGARTLMQSSGPPAPISPQKLDEQRLRIERLRRDAVLRHQRGQS